MALPPRDSTLSDALLPSPFAGTAAAQKTPTVATVHPLVLLSVVDHYERVNRGAAVPRRVVGLLLGTTSSRPPPPPQTNDSSSAAAPAAPVPSDHNSASDVCHVDASNCFAVPFEEASADVWFLDTTYAVEMHAMVRKVLPTATVVGWYSSGSRIDPCDSRVHRLIADRFSCNPLYCLINVDHTVRGAPVHAYVAIDPRRSDGHGTPAVVGDNDDDAAAAAAAGDDRAEFAHIPCALTSTEAETIGVEQLLRDIEGSTTTLQSCLTDRSLSLNKLADVLRAIEAYMHDVGQGRVENPSQDVLGVVQQILGMRPVLHQLRSSTAMTVSANDEALATFVASTARTVMSLYDVVLNRKRVAAELDALRQKRRDDAAAAAAAVAAVATTSGTGV